MLTGKVLFSTLVAELNDTITCSQREPASWSSVILNDEVSANAILKRATRHYTVVIKPQAVLFQASIRPGRCPPH